MGVVQKSPGSFDTLKNNGYSIGPCSICNIGLCFIHCFFLQISKCVSWHDASWLSPSHVIHRQILDRVSWLLNDPNYCTSWLLTKMWITTVARVSGSLLLNLCCWLFLFPWTLQLSNEKQWIKHKSLSMIRQEPMLYPLFYSYLVVF